MTRSSSAADDRIDRIAALGEPVRRALYEFVVAAPTPVNRDQAALGVGVPRHVAKFHLDKLTADGLLTADYQRPKGRSGPGAGRPAKRYRRAAGEITVSLPERRYDLAAKLMADAIAESGATGTPVQETLCAAARQAGSGLAAEARRRLDRRSGTAAVLSAISATLAEVGYEPHAQRGRVTLGNCPFHTIAAEHTELVCGMNLDLIAGLVDAVGAAGAQSVQARLEPDADKCCVTLNAEAGRER